MQKFIFIINYPRGGGKSISSLKKIHQNSSFFIWPYEFFYFNLFNQASGNKKKEIGFRLNNFFFNEVKKKIYKFKNKINFSLFKKKLEIKNDIYFNNIEYLSFLVYSLKSSYIFQQSIKKIDYFIINTTARGFDWTLVNKKKNFLFTNRNFLDCFYSIRKNTIGSSGFYNFFHFSGKKSFFYWLETFRLIKIRLDNVATSSNYLKLIFENKKFNENKRQFINNKNSKLILDYFKINENNENNENNNFYFDVHKSKIVKFIELSKIENYLIEKYCEGDEIKVKDYFKFLFLSLYFFFKNLENMPIIKKIYRLNKIMFNFIFFYFIRYKKSKILKAIYIGNKHLQFFSLWR